ncbi:MAG: hypothetical protein VYA84_20760 [Planctomycetota bacterium]|nr:hypothetical protein [Planctomycetota bacterium]
MGGITTLLSLLAAGGITYGWKPDDRGGVEYIIQVPPEQLQELPRLGQISSTIDPAVRGQVSRVVVQIGEGPLPRITPPAMPSKSGRSANFGVGGAGIAAEDAALIPIPEMSDSSMVIPIAGIESGSNQAVMKPQTGNTMSASGFALPPSLSSPAPATTPQVETAGREISNPAKPADSSARNVIPPPATRIPGSTTLPPFTGRDRDAVSNVSNNAANSAGLTTGMATVRPGGPSTDPTNSRDSQWSQLGQNQPSITTTNPNSVVSSAPVLPPTASSSSSGTPAGLNASDTFGRAPSAVSADDPTWSNSGFANNATPTGGTGSVNGMSATNTEGNPFRNPTNTSTAPNRSMLTPAQIAAGGWSVDIYGNQIDRDGRPVTNTHSGANYVSNPGQIRHQPIPSTASQGTLESGLQTQASHFARGSHFAPDSHFAQGNQTRGNAGSRGAIGNVPAGNSTMASLGTPAARTVTHAPTNYVNPHTAGGAAVDPNSGSPTTYQRPQQNSLSTAAGAGKPNSGSAFAGATGLSDPHSVASGSHRDSTLANRRQSSEPLVTWLLLISFVSNVYLIFWMKQLLMRYRDLVAAKRVSDSQAAA